MTRFAQLRFCKKMIVYKFSYGVVYQGKLLLHSKDRAIGISISSDFQQNHLENQH